MKFKTILLLLFISLGAFAQNKADAEKLVDEGVELHDKEDYVGAINKYDNALGLDKDNLFAFSEKSLTLNSLKKYDESISICKLAILKHPNEDVKNIYVNYGNALDYSKRTEEALKVYDQGIVLYPNYYQLQYNKGICLSGSGNDAASNKCFQKSFLINPNHASSINALGILETENNRIAAILAFSRFLIVEPQTTRSQINLKKLQQLIMQGVTEKSDKSVNIQINSMLLPDSSNNSQVKENNFSSTDLVLSMASALDYDKENVNKTDVEKFIRKFDVICASLNETQKGNFGFYWEYFAPYFIEMKKNNLIESFAYIAFVNTNNEDVLSWHKKNSDQVEKFYNWSKKYNWQKH